MHAAAEVGFWIKNGRAIFGPVTLFFTAEGDFWHNLPGFGLKKLANFPIFAKELAF